MKANKNKLLIIYSALLVLIISLVLSSINGSTQTYFSFFSEPWMIFTILDFYVLIALISLWMWKKESKNHIRLLWIILFIVTGAIGVFFYILTLVYQKKKLL